MAKSKKKYICIYIVFFNRCLAWLQFYLALNTDTRYVGFE